MEKIGYFQCDLVETKTCHLSPIFQNIEVEKTMLESMQMKTMQMRTKH